MRHPVGSLPISAYDMLTFGLNIHILSYVRYRIEENTISILYIYKCILYTS